jgi:hypothetical protein
MSSREAVQEAVSKVHDMRRKLTPVNENEMTTLEEDERRVPPIVKMVNTWTKSEVKDMIRQSCRLTNVLRGVSSTFTTEIDEEIDMDNGEENESTTTGLEVQIAKGVLQRCMETLFYLEQALCTLDITARSLGSLSSDAPLPPPSNRLEETEGDDIALAPGVARFAGIDSEAKISSTQQLILYILNVVFSRGYSRCGLDCYERLTLCPPSLRGSGVLFDTRAWRRVCSIKELIYDVTRKEIKFDQWLNLTNNSRNAQTVVDYMTNCSDAQFSLVSKNRHVFSFRNGIYITSEDAVLDTNFAHVDARTRRDNLRDAFLPYGSRSHLELSPDIASCKYVDLDFPEHQFLRLSAPSAPQNEDWYSVVPTPHLQSILDFQHFDEGVCRWMYVFIGRLLYELNEYDGWQVMPYLKGQASTGKSTIVHMCRDMYEFCDVGMLSNNVERKFGISAFCDKYMYVAPEIKSDLQLEQAEFQSMVSGESVQVATKFKDARTVQWNVPGIMAGNEVPGWVDNSGSISRRIVVFDFMRKVVDGDMELKQKLQREMPDIILKCNRAYHEAVRQCGSDNIWNHLPEYFKRTKEELTESTNPIQHFMSSGKLSYDDPDAYMPMDTLKRAFQSHCEENNFKKIRLTKDKFEPVMFDFGLTVEKSPHGITRQYPRSSGAASNANAPAVPQHQHRNITPVCHKEWCIGADLTSNYHHATFNGSNNNNCNVFDNVSFENGLL